MQPSLQQPAHVTSRAAGWKRALPLAAIAAAVGVALFLRLDQYLTFDQLRLHRSELAAFVASMPVEALGLFVIAYAFTTATSFPGAAVLTLTGGFLFGRWQGTAAVVFGATIGASALFLVARTALGDALKTKAGPWLSQMENSFNTNAFSYLLVLRLVPAVPFFVVNLVPAFLGVPLRTFVATTALGIIPGTFVFASIGAGLGSIFDANEQLSFKGVFTPEIVAALMGMALLSLIPVAMKRFGAVSSPSS